MPEGQPATWSAEQIQSICSGFTHQREALCPQCGHELDITKSEPDALGHSRVSFSCAACGRHTVQTFMTIGPADFIHGPFSKCPKCGKQELGLLSVQADRYTKRCRSCLGFVNGRLPAVKKHVIYLDQLAISNMMFALNPSTPQYRENRVDPFWRKLFEKLDTLVKLQLLVCPDTDVQEYESLTHEHYESLRRVFQHFSLGVTFYNLPTLERFQVQVHARNWLQGAPDTPPTLDRRRILHGEPDGWADVMHISVRSPVTEEDVDALRASRESTHDGVRELFERWRGEVGTKFEEWFEREVRAFGKTVLDTYDRFLAKLVLIREGRVQPTSDDFDLPRDAVLFTMIQNDFQREGLSEVDAWNRTRAYLSSSSLKVVPMVRISALLWAAVARKAAAGMKKPPTRGAVNDIRVISAVLPYSDAIFVDNEMRAYLSEEPLVSELSTRHRVFSASNRDEFLEFLDEIGRGATPSHLKLVEQVYGKEWTQPYTSMFGEKAQDPQEPPAHGES